MRRGPSRHWRRAFVQSPGKSVPDGNKVIPLVGMLANGGFKSTHDFLRQLVPRLPRTQRRPIVSNFRKNACGVASLGARQVNRQERAPGGPRQFGSRNRSPKFPAEQFHQRGAGFGGAVHQEGNDRAGFEPPYDFDESERISPNDQGFDAPARSRRPPHFGQLTLWFGQCDDQQRDAPLRQQRRAEFPVSK